MCVRARLVIAIIISCILAACSTGPDRPVYYQYEKKYHTVLKGDTLYSIAYQHGLDYKELAAWNKIGKPYTIFPGQKILLKLSAPSKGLNSATRKRTEVPAAAAATNRKPIKAANKRFHQTIHRSKTGSARVDLANQGESNSEILCERKS